MYLRGRVQLYEDKLEKEIQFKIKFQTTTIKAGFKPVDYNAQMQSPTFVSIKTISLLII